MSGLPWEGRTPSAPPSTFSCAVFWVVIIVVICFVVLQPPSCGWFLLYRAAWRRMAAIYRSLTQGKSVNLKSDSLILTLCVSLFVYVYVNVCANLPLAETDLICQKINYPGHHGPLPPWSLGRVPGGSQASGVCLFDALPGQIVLVAAGGSQPPCRPAPESGSQRADELTVVRTKISALVLSSAMFSDSMDSISGGWSVRPSAAAAAFLQNQLASGMRPFRRRTALRRFS